MRTMLSVALWAIALPAFSVEPAYLALEITSPSANPLSAAGLNNNGDIVGSTGANAFVYLHRTRNVYLLPHPTPNSTDSGTALNDYGKVGGTSAAFGEAEQSAVWFLSGGSEVLGGGTASYVTGVSNDGQVTANDFTNHGNTFGHIWAWKPTLHEIPVPMFFDFNCCYPTATANGINNVSHVVGDSSLSQFTTPTHSDFIEGDHAYLYANGTLTDLGVLGNPHPADSLGTSVAYGLNNHDDVVGQSETSVLSNSPTCPGCVVLHAFVWRRGQLTDLGNLGHVPQWTSIANAINDADEIVGSADANVAGIPTTRAFVYVNGSMYNLTFLVHHRDLNVRLVNAVGINCNGWIVANGYDVTQPKTNRVYLLVPETTPLRPGCPMPR
jgi:probable HAF family extracellular repeat protein